MLFDTVYLLVEWTCASTKCKLGQEVSNAKRLASCSACVRCIDAWSCGQSSVYATKYATRTVIMYSRLQLLKIVCKKKKLRLFFRPRAGPSAPGSVVGSRAWESLRFQHSRGSGGGHEIMRMRPPCFMTESGARTALATLCTAADWRGRVLVGGYLWLGHFLLYFA